MLDPVDNVIARWAPLAGEGLEHLHLCTQDGQIVANSTVIGARGGVAYGAQYRVTCDTGWHVREFSVVCCDGRQLGMTADGEGKWMAGDGSHDARFDGCIDIDLAATPFTNTLPIRRAGLRKGEHREFRMLYVSFDTLKPTVDGQIYTCLEQGALYRYEASDRSFIADLPVDNHGLVRDYPTLFRRVT